MKRSDNYFIRPVSDTCHRHEKSVFNVRYLMVAGIVALFIAACTNSDEKETYNPGKSVIVTSFSPDSGGVRDMVLLDGDNFGSDPSMIRVFFNESEAKVIGSTGKRILAAVPRLPGDTCILTVEVGKQRKKYDGYFLYKVAASVTTIAGNGTSSHVYDQGLDKAQLVPVYIGMDNNFNIFVTDNNNTLVRINEAQNLIQVLATADMGYNHRCIPYINPRTNVMQLGAEGQGVRDRFMFLDPKDGWAPRLKFIKEWDANGYSLPSGGTGNEVDANESHYLCLLCEADNMYYVRYRSGAIVRIDPDTWKAKIIGMTPSGIAFGVAFHPARPSEMWIGYDGAATGSTGWVANSLSRLDVLDEETTGEGANRMLASYERLSGPISAGHRDGPLHQSQFNRIRMINFDADGNLYVGDCDNHCIRRVNTNTNPMMVETVIGIPQVGGYKDGNRDEALFQQPHGIATDAEGVVYVAEYGNRRVRRIAIE
jgi:hypothetical protein